MTKSQTKTQSLTSIIQKIAKGLNKFTIDDILQLGEFKESEVKNTLIILEKQYIIKKLSDREYLYIKMKAISDLKPTDTIHSEASISQNSDWLTMEQVQELTKEKLETIRRKCKSGKYVSKYTKIGRFKKYKVHKLSISKNIKDNKKRCTPQLKNMNLEIDERLPFEEQKIFKNKDEQKIYDEAPEYAQKFIMKYLTVFKMLEKRRGKNIGEGLKDIAEKYPDYKIAYTTFMTRRRKFIKYGIKGLIPAYEGKRKKNIGIENEAYEYFKKIYLTQNGPTLQQSVKMLARYGFDTEILPSTKTFRRYLDKEYSKEEILKLRLPTFKIPDIKVSNIKEAIETPKNYYETFIQGAEEFLNNTKNKTDNSSVSQRGFLTNHLMPYFKNFRFDEITQNDLIKFQSKMLAEGFSIASLNMVISVLSKIYRTYAKIDSSLTFSIKNNIFEPLEIDHLPDKEIRRIKKNNCPEVWIICLGINIGELLALRYEDIDFKNKIVTIDKISYKNAVQSHRRQYRIRNLKLPDCIFKLLDKKRSGIIFNEVNIENYDILLNTHIHLMLEKNVQINLISKNLGYQCLNDFEARFNFLLPQRLDENFEII